MWASEIALALKRRITDQTTPVRVTFGVSRVKAAVTLFDVASDTVQVLALVEQAAPQPLKLWPVAGAAVRTIVVLGARLAEQAVRPFPQEIAPPLTVPLPVTVTVSVTC